jgi:hypothetical protein
MCIRAKSLDGQCVIIMIQNLFKRHFPWHCFNDNQELASFTIPIEEVNMRALAIKAINIMRITPFE